MTPSQKDEMIRQEFTSALKEIAEKIGGEFISRSEIVVPSQTVPKRYITIRLTVKADTYNPEDELRHYQAQFKTLEEKRNEMQEILQARKKQEKTEKKYLDEIARLEVGE